MARVVRTDEAGCWPRGQIEGALGWFGSQPPTGTGDRWGIVLAPEMLRGTLYLGLGRYDAALDAVRQAERYHKEGLAIWTLTQVIEGAARSGQPELAGRALELLVETTRASGTQ